MSLTALLKKCSYLPQQGAVFIGQEPWPVQEEPQPDWGQPAAQEDAPSAPSAHGPVQFSWHPVCPHDSLLGQTHDPACPRANPIPASSRTIDTIASFFM